MVGPGFLLTVASSVAKAVTLFAVLMAHLIYSVSRIKDPFAKSLACRIQKLLVQIGPSESCITNIRNNNNPVVQLHYLALLQKIYSMTFISLALARKVKELY